MKLALAVTLGGLQGLGTTEDGRERPVDRLHALAKAIGPVERRSESQCERGDYAAQDSYLCSLGTDLIAFKFGKRIPSRSMAELSLAIALGWKRWGLKLRRSDYDRIAKWAIVEWTHDYCMACHGAKQVPNYQNVDGAQPMKPCEHCHSTGLRLYTDPERIEAMGAPYARAMGWAHSLIAQAEALAVRSAKDRLERK